MLNREASEVTESVLKKIIPHFGLPLSVQSDNRGAFIAKVTWCLGPLEYNGSYMLRGDLGLWERLKR